MRQAEADAGKRKELLSSEEREELAQLRKDNRELRRANEILKSASAFRGRARPTPTEVSSFITEHRERFGVEPICAILEVSASAYYERAKGRRSASAIEDEHLLARIREIHERNYCAYGYRRMWIALRREGEEVGRGRVQRLMKGAGIQGVKRRGKAWRVVEYIAWFNNDRLHESLGDLPPAEFGGPIRCPGSQLSYPQRRLETN